MINTPGPSAAQNQMTDQRENMPTFLFIGGQRCGSSWVHKCLAEHPDVFTATPKEVHYFNRNYEKGERWYLDHFRDAGQAHAIGEVTPDYIADPECPQRVHTLSSDLRLVAVLREPIERAHSLYRLKLGTTMPYDTFNEAVEKHPDMIEHGHYAEHLERWWSRFPREQMLVLLYEDLVRSDAETIRKIYEHIGVRSDFVPSWIGKTDNAAVFPSLRAKLRRAGLDPLVKAVGRSFIGDRIRARVNAKKKNAEGIDIDPELKRSLDAHYKPHNDRLRTILGRPLENWS